MYTKMYLQYKQTQLTGKCQYLQLIYKLNNMGHLKLV